MIAVPSFEVDVQNAKTVKWSFPARVYLWRKQLERSQCSVRIFQPCPAQVHTTPVCFLCGIEHDRTDNIVQDDFTFPRTEDQHIKSSAHEASGLLNTSNFLHLFSMVFSAAQGPK